MTAAATRTGGVVGALDARTPTRFYWSLTLLATIGGFLFGFDTSNIGSVLGFIPGTRMPESPRWLLRQGRYEDARAALAELGVDVSTEEVRDAAAEIVSEKETGPRRRLWTPGVKRALMVVCVFFMFQQITGINVPLYYGPKLLGPLFQTGDSKVAEVLAGVQVTAIMTVVNVAPTYLAFRYIDRAGRRPLAIGGYAGMAVFAFIASFALGVGGTGWLIQGEVFPTEVRGGVRQDPAWIRFSHVILAQDSGDFPDPNGILEARSKRDLGSS